MKQFFVTSLPVFVCGFWTLVLLLDAIWRNSGTHRRWLTVFMAVATTLYVCHFVFFNHMLNLIPVSDTVYIFSHLAVHPLFLIYLFELTSRSIRPRWYLTWLCPAALIGAGVGITYLLAAPQDAEAFINNYLYYNDTSSLEGLGLALVYLHRAAKVIFTLEVLCVLYVGYRLTYQFDRQVLATYSDVEGKTMWPIRLILTMLIVTSIVSLLCNAVGRYWFIGTLWWLAIPSTCFSVLLFTIGYAGLKQDFSMADMVADMVADMETGPNSPPLPMEEEEPIATQQQPATSSTDLLASHLEKLMTDERLYLQPDLKVTDLAKALNTNRVYVQQAIGRSLGTTFSEYVNRRRIDHAVALMKSQPEKSILDIALMSGFSSQASFYRNFNHFLHCSPKELKTLLEEQEKKASNA